jgi:hypothetical protein
MDSMLTISGVCKGMTTKKVWSYSLVELNDMPGAATENLQGCGQFPPGMPVSAHPPVRPAYIDPVLPSESPE